MDAIDLMAIKPWQIREALGKDRIVVIRGSREVYNARQRCSRRNSVSEDEAEETSSLETKPVWICTDLACGGVLKRRFKAQKVKPVMEEHPSQTDPNDTSHYWDTPEELRSHNLTILTGKPRDIQQRPGSQSQRRGSNISITQRGSMASVGSQTNLGNRERSKSKAAIFVSQKFSALSNFFRNILSPELIPEEETSDDEEIPANEPEERDHEWLEHTSTELSQDDMQEAFEADLISNPPPPRKIELQCHNLISPVTPLFWVLKLGGRWPFQAYVEDRLVKFRLNRRSLSFTMFVFTTLLMIICTSQAAFTTIRLLTSGSEVSSYERRKMNLLFNKYWPFAFVTIICTVYASIWSLACMFDDGRFIADFMSRWNFAVVTVNYNASPGVRTEVWLSLGWLVFYFSCLTSFYVFDMIPAVRGTSYLLGGLVLGSIVSEENRLKYHTAVSLFGFVFHLYVVYASRAATMLVLVYCKFLENIARRWNLRFCYVAGMLGRFEPPNLYITYHTVVPYTKLFMEHKLLLSLSRHTSTVFSVVLGVYFVEKGLEILLLCYRTACLVMFTEHEEVERGPNLKCPPGLEDCVPIPYEDEPVFLVMTLLYVTCQSIIGWYITTESVSSCGTVIMSGFNFVRRYGFPRCKNSKERRFIQSLKFSFTPTINYFINCGFTIDRNFTYEMFALVFAFVTMLIAFSPFQLDTQEITICRPSVDDSIICSSTTITRSARREFIENLEKEMPGSMPIDTTGLVGEAKVDKINQELKISLTTTSTAKPPRPDPPVGPPPPEPPVKPDPEVKPKPDPEVKPTPDPEVKPKPDPEVTPKPDPIVTPKPDPVTTSCAKNKPYKECNRPPRGGVLQEYAYLPIACDKHGDIIPPFEPSSPAAAAPSDSDKGCYSPKYFKPSIAYSHITETLYYCNTDCKTEIMNNPKDYDDCGNLPFSSTGKPPIMKAVVVQTDAGGFNLRQCCCYDYEWYPIPGDGTDVHLNNCGIRNAQQAAFSCKKCTKGTKVCPPPASP